MTSERGQSQLSAHFSNSRKGDGALELEWEDIRFSMLVKDAKNSKPFRTVYKEKQILKGVSGRVTSGQLLAVMGPTGCGKTSLMNVLAARTPSGGSNFSSLTGNVRVNDVNRDEAKFRSISAYVLQDDYLYAHLTVLETLQIAATFFLASDTPQENKDSLVEAVIAELGLVKARDTIIGDEKMRGVSGGERKRAAIAGQLIADPAVLFLDEPTSGLDAFQALSVMESMKSLALNGRIVITVIHQPRSSIFDMFDRLLLLSEGKTMYFGTAEHAVQYFSTIGYPCHDFYNPSDFFLDILSPDNRTTELEEESASRIKLIGDEWVTRGNSLAAAKSTQPHGEVRSVGAAINFQKIMKNFSVLCWRAWSEQSRDVVTFCIKLVFCIFFALIIGGIYSNIGNSQNSIQNRKGVLFFVCINVAFNTILSVFNTFPKEKNVVNRERANNAYDTTSYFLAKVFVEIPLNMIPPIVYSCILYWLVKLQPARFGYFILILMLEAVSSVALGLAVSTAMPTVEAANAAGTPMIVIGILFGGFYIDVNSIPIVANWIPYMSIFRWTFEALCINEFTGLTFNCDDATGVCIATGAEALETLSFSHHTTNYAVFGLGMVLIAFLTVAYINLARSNMAFLPVGHVGKSIKGYLSSQPKDQQAAATTSKYVEVAALAAEGKEDIEVGTCKPIDGSRD